MKILIATGIYPPDIGGPATYAKNVEEVWKTQGHDVRIATFRWERLFPTGLRHLLFFFKVLLKGFNVDLILVLDTWSAAVPVMYACKLLRKRYIIRTGGDFLWESYLNRTGEKVLLSNFYRQSIGNLNRKERLIYSLTKKVLRSATAVIFSTDWQKGIFELGYHLGAEKSFVVENQYRPSGFISKPINRTFVASTRNIKLKNLDALKEAFVDAQREISQLGLPEITLDLKQYTHNELAQVVKNSYAVVLVSLSEISPNFVMEAINCGTPSIVTRENGINTRISNYVLSVDPLDKDDIKNKIVWLANPENRTNLSAKLAGFNFSHTWEEIGQEILGVAEKKGII